MGLFSRTKKSTPTPTPTGPQKPGLVEGFALQKHQTGFLKHATRDENGYPMASRVYYNTNPPISCPELQQNSVFILDGNNVDLYQKRDLERSIYNFSTVYDSNKDHNAIKIVGASPNYELIRSWLNKCHKEHRGCQETGSLEKLKIIRLIDVRNRCLVQYKSGLQYVALSYVWGNVPGPKQIPGRPSDFPTNISKTIRHAMVVAEKIGIPYLWADAVCIEQHNQKDKDQQLPLMDYIYEHAFATIIALGNDANFGLPGVQDGPKRFPQIFAEFGPVKLVARSPSLSSQIMSSIWSTRGWTYQEGLFSRRCIYFSQNQVYFHCNSMFCTEDSPVEKSISWNASSKASVKPAGQQHADVSYITRNSLLKSKTHQIDQTVGNIDLFQSYFVEYNSRKVSYDEDAIRAFSALLSYLQRNSYPGGFIHGIPRDAFRDGLLWNAYGSVCRREKGGFPSWSWAAWKSNNGGMGYHALFYKSGKSVHPPLQISLGRNQLYTSPTIDTRFSALGSELQDLWNDYRARDTRPFLAKTNPSLPLANALYIDGPIGTIPVTYDPATQAIGFDVPPPLVPKVRLEYGSSPAPRQVKIKHDFLIMDTKHVETFPGPLIQFRLLMLQWKSKDVATRAGVFTVTLESGLAAFWKYVGVRRSRLWLI